MFGEYSPLNVPWRVVVVVIEACFADCDDTFFFEQVRQAIRARCCIVWVNTHGREHTIVACRDRYGLSRPVVGHADRDHLGYTSLMGRFDPRVAVGAKWNVAVIVNPDRLHCQTFNRGNSGSPASNSSPPG